jgi:hypothetical protein
MREPGALSNEITHSSPQRCGRRTRTRRSTASDDRGWVDPCHSSPLVILLTAIIAAAAPAWRASRINPVEAFRYEG